MLVRDLHASVRFYTEILGLEVSDWISDQMVFLHFGSDRHDLALAQLPSDEEHLGEISHQDRPGLDHFSYLVDGIAEMEKLADFLQERGVEIVRGIGKHGPGENFFLVFKDPDGNNVEVYCDMRQITQADPYTPAVWERDIFAFDRWYFEKFRGPPPRAFQAELDEREKRTNGPDSPEERG